MKGWSTSRGGRFLVAAVVLLLGLSSLFAYHRASGTVNDDLQRLERQQEVLSPLQRELASVLEAQHLVVKRALVLGELEWAALPSEAPAMEASEEQPEEEQSSPSSEEEHDEPEPLELDEEEPREERVGELQDSGEETEVDAEVGRVEAAAIVQETDYEELREEFDAFNSRVHRILEQVETMGGEEEQSGGISFVAEGIERIEQEHDAYVREVHQFFSAVSEEAAFDFEAHRRGVEERRSSLHQGLDELEREAHLGQAEVLTVLMERRRGETLWLVMVVLALLLFAGLVFRRGRDRETIADLANRAELLGEEILAAVHQQGVALEQTSASVSETTTTTSELGQTSRAAADRAAAVAEVAEQSQMASVDALGIVKEGIAAMGRIRDEVEEIAENILHLSEKNVQIGEITDSVGAIAEQCNLLAINASIEASKAGDAGQGFSVVASEVKALAEQSKLASRRIRKIVAEIQKSSNSAVMVTEQGTKRVEEGSELVENLGGKIQELSEVIDDSAQAAIQIKLTGNEQLSGIDQITRAMTSIEKATTESAAGVRQLEEYASQLKDFSEQLQSAVSAT